MSAQAIALRFIIILLFFISAPLVDAQSKYSKTISALQNRYIDEIHTFNKYSAYFHKALSEDYPNIAYLFVALAASESIHARNFKRLLTDLGVQIKEIPIPEFQVSSTKKNLNNAATVEIEEIKREYPRLIDHMKPEDHEAAIRNMKYAWNAEEQHHDLMKKVLSGTGIFFGMLAKKMKRLMFNFLCVRYVALR